MSKSRKFRQELRPFLLEPFSPKSATNSRRARQHHSVEILCKGQRAVGASQPVINVFDELGVNGRLPQILVSSTTLNCDTLFQISSSLRLGSEGEAAVAVRPGLADATFFRPSQYWEP